MTPKVCEVSFPQLYRSCIKNICIFKFLLATYEQGRPRDKPSKTLDLGNPPPMRQPQEKKKFFLSFSLSCSLLQMAGSTEKKMMKEIGEKQAKEIEQNKKQKAITRQGNQTLLQLQQEHVLGEKRWEQFPKHFLLLHLLLLTSSFFIFFSLVF